MRPVLCLLLFFLHFHTPTCSLQPYSLPPTLPALYSPSLSLPGSKLPLSLPAPLCSTPPFSPVPSNPSLTTQSHSYSIHPKPYFLSPYIASACANKSTQSASALISLVSAALTQEPSPRVRANMVLHTLVMATHVGLLVRGGRGKTWGYVLFFCIFKGACFSRYICGVLRGINTLRRDRY